MVLFVYFSFTQQTRQVVSVMAETLPRRGLDVTEAAIGLMRRSRRAPR
jgi:hypothetical protein